MRRRIKKNGAYGTNLRVVDAYYNSNRIEEVTVASDAKNSYTKLINADREGDADIQENVSATFTENGTYEVLPWPTKDGMEKATVTVAIPLEANKETSIDVSTYTEPVEVLPSSGKTAMNKNTVTLTNIPPVVELEDNKTATIDVSGYTEPVEITPTSGKDAMEKATVTLTNFPAVDVVQLNKSATVNVASYNPLAKPEIEPDVGYDTMAKATVTLTGIPVIEATHSASIDVSTYTTPVTVEPNVDNDAMEEVEITLTNVPVLEANKAQTIDVQSYTMPVEITPTSGNDAMRKATVTLSNVPDGRVYLHEWNYGTRAIYTPGIPDETFDGRPVLTIEGMEIGLDVSTDTSTVYHYDAVDANKYITYNGHQYNYVGQTCTLSQIY